MSTEDTKPATTTPEPKKPPAEKSIPVAMLKLSDREPMDLPGLGGKSAVTATSYDKIFDAKGKRVLTGKCWTVDFFPGIRHHRVTYYSDGVKPPEVRMVWEGHVKIWEPLAL